MKKKLINKLKRIIKFLNKEFFKLKLINTRIYKDMSKDNLKIDLKPGLKTDFAFSTFFIINYNEKKIEKEIFYSNLTLLSLLKNYINDFNSILDIGSHAGNCSDIFKFLGKNVTRCEHLEIYESEYKTDFIVTDFKKKFDCIWASQVLEHQRNYGLFLNKCFNDLNENGILAITVPYRTGDDDYLEFGHCTNFTPLNLIYNLVLSGFDCSKIKLKIYDDNIGVILRKKNNGIDRSLSMASTLPQASSTNPTIIMNGKSYNMKNVTEKEIFDNFKNSMPLCINLDNVTYFLDNNINWPEHC
jgi:hypothetical protein